MIYIGHPNDYTKDDPNAVIFTILNPISIPPTLYPIKNNGKDAIDTDQQYPCFGYRQYCQYDIAIGDHSKANIDWGSTGDSNNKFKYIQNDRMKIKERDLRYLFTTKGVFSDIELECYEVYSI